MEKTESELFICSNYVVFYRFARTYEYSYIRTFVGIAPFSTQSMCHFQCYSVQYMCSRICVYLIVSRLQCMTFYTRVNVFSV